MRLDTEFIQIPLLFDAALLASEVAGFSEQEWHPHPEGHRGNAAMPLLAVDGDPFNNATKGAMRPTPQLERCPYLGQVLAALDAPIGRTRLMRIDGNAEATEHVDVNYYWQQRMRVHVPIVTDPAVRFLCGDKSLHMGPGEAWIFDTWRMHNVVNPRPSRRIHLVADTVGSAALASLIKAGRRPFDPAAQPGAEARQVSYRAGATTVLQHEGDNFPVVMSPAEQRILYANIERVLPATDAAAALHAEVTRHLEAWQAVWAVHESRPAGWREYGELIESGVQVMSRFRNAVTLGNNVDAAYAIEQVLLAPALNTDLAPRATSTRGTRGRFARPIFIVSSPRSGSSLLFETLAQSPDVFSIGGESHALIEGIESLHPAAGGWQSNELTEAHATPDVVEDLSSRFAAAALRRDGNPPRPGRFRLLEKTPKNSLRIPFLRAAYPDALFIYLYRDERATISSMLEAWRSGRFTTYPDLPGWSGLPWSLLLVPGWRDMVSMPLAEIAVRQWKAVTDTLLDDLGKLPDDAWCVASYDRLIANPQEEIQRLCKFVGIGWDRELTIPLPSSNHTLTPPDPAKWLANSALLEPFLPIAKDTAERARAVFAHQPLRREAPNTPRRADEAASENAAAFRSVHTSNLPGLFAQLGSSLLVSTYQSGRVIALRADGDQLNTHLRYFPSPMGMAFDGQRLALGTLKEIWEYHNMPDVAERLHPQKHDACFMPRNMHVTGDIRLHEIAFDADGELWLVNTRFSALCTLDRHHSFVPRWRPSFVTALAAEDRCHLNGLCMRDGRPRYVTALGRTDTNEGWRADKTTGGVIIDVPSQEIVAAGLSMPHSPRWHDGKLWVLESAKGTVATIDPATGRCETVAELPGFTRGLAFSGHLAFVGLSQVRESVFEGIPLGKRLRPEDRCCGVWVINTRSGATVGFVKFEQAVQEIFDLQLLPAIRYPDILEPDADLIGASFVLSAEALAEVAPVHLT